MGLDLKKLQKVYNSTRRKTLVLLMDISYSMKNRVPVLNNAMQKFIHETKKNDLMNNVDVLFLCFNGDTIVKTRFVPLEQIDEEIFQVNETEVRGWTDTGKALLTALELLNQKEVQDQLEGVQRYKPWLFLLTDGYPSAWQNAPREEEIKIEKSYRLACATLRQLQENKKIIVVAAGIQTADFSSLKMLTDHVINVSEATRSINAEKFFDVICTTMTNPETSVSDIIAEIL